MSRPVLAFVLATAMLSIAACAGPASPTPSSTPTERPASPTASAGSPALGIDLSTVPTACIGLGADDCRRIVAEVAALVPSGIAARYVEVGPFGCTAGEGCARSLVGRPEGDVTIESADGVLSYHVRAGAGGGNLAIERQDSFLMPLRPESQPPVTPGVRPFTLGHCGLWSGVDVGGSWWDPVGPIDGDHPAAINSADGTLAILDGDRATFTSKTGFTVQLIRREGPKAFPGCM